MVQIPASLPQAFLGESNGDPLWFLDENDLKYKAVAWFTTMKKADSLWKKVGGALLQPDHMEAMLKAVKRHKAMGCVAVLIDPDGVQQQGSVPVDEFIERLSFVLENEISMQRAARYQEDPKELAAVQEWAKKQYKACPHGTLSTAIRPDNSSQPGITWHPFWTARVHVVCDTCGKEEFIFWSRNDHKDATFGAK